jgi:hypothetical protein
LSTYLRAAFFAQMTKAGLKNSYFTKHFHTFALVAMLAKLQFASDFALFAICFLPKFDEIDACCFAKLVTYVQTELNL